MVFSPAHYGPDVARILALDGSGGRTMPLVAKPCASSEARDALRSARAETLFDQAPHSAEALAGLWLYFSCLDEAHQLVQNSGSHEAMLWHAILHRMEPDEGNSAFWYRKAGAHPAFRPLSNEAAQILKRLPNAEFRAGGKWDPYAFVMFCERAREQPGSESERAALEIQLAEWQILFDYCARPK